MLKLILGLFGKIFRDKTSQLAATAFTLSLIAIAVIWVLFAASISVAGGHWTVQVNNLGIIPATIFIGIFLMNFFVIWFILYIQYVKEAEDVYSHL